MKFEAIRTSDINEFTNLLTQLTEIGYSVVSSGLAGGQYKAWWAILVKDGPE
jgi:hypothetical protein